METEIEIETETAITDAVGQEDPILLRRGRGREMRMRRIRDHPDGALKLVMATISDRRRLLVVQKCRRQVALERA